MSSFLSLDPRETLLKDCLVECAQSLKPLEIRFAGGWVRDKLLGIQSDDIDVALSTLSGKEFGNLLVHFYAEHGTRYKKEATRLGIDNIELNKIVLVEEDAEKSKHLAVAKVKLFGLEVDLVNLRTETYASNSRTPVIKIGTAKEDALRRDATINALFYNIHTEQVEDFTGRGLEDMKNKIMRTPLEPYQTFRDDPLRVLRLIRIASKLDFDIDVAAQIAMKSSEIHESLKLKISRERVRAEIMKALESCRPARALLFIHDLDLFSCCFADPADSHPPSPQNLPQIYQFLGSILAESLLTKGLQLHQESAALPWLLAAYTPWQPSKPDYGCQAIKASIKATAREAKLLTAAITHRAEMSHLISKISESGNTVTRGTIGMALRRWGRSWGHQALFALLCDFERFGAETSLRVYGAFLQHLKTLGLDGTRAHDEKPLLDGMQVKDILAREKGGPANKLAADLVMEWQFDHPDPGPGCARECAEMLTGKREEILRREAQMAGSTRMKRGADEVET